MPHPTHIISPTGKRISTLKPVQTAREWARDNGHEIISDIISQGERRVWVRPLSAYRRRLRDQMQAAHDRALALQGAPA